VVGSQVDAASVQSLGKGRASTPTAPPLRGTTLQVLYSHLETRPTFTVLTYGSPEEAGDGEEGNGKKAAAGGGKEGEKGEGKGRKATAVPPRLESHPVSRLTVALWLYPFDASDPDAPPPGVGHRPPARTLTSFFAPRPPAAGSEGGGGEGSGSKPLSGAGGGGGSGEGGMVDLTGGSETESEDLAM
jgi:hypothetical protein